MWGIGNCVLVIEIHICFKSEFYLFNLFVLKYLEVDIMKVYVQQNYFYIYLQKEHIHTYILSKSTIHLSKPL